MVPEPPKWPYSQIAHPTHVRELLKRSGDAQPMVLTAEQHLRIALLYEKAAADRLGVPPQQRAAFARKAKWFRMKARISAKKEAAAAIPARRLAEAWVEGASPEPAHLQNGSVHPSEDHGGTPQEQSYRSISERIAAVRTTRAVAG